MLQHSAVCCYNVVCCVKDEGPHRCQLQCPQEGDAELEQANAEAGASQHNGAQASRPAAAVRSASQDSVDSVDSNTDNAAVSLTPALPNILQRPSTGVLSCQQAERSLVVAIRCRRCLCRAVRPFFGFSVWLSVFMKLQAPWRSFRQRQVAAEPAGGAEAPKQPERGHASLEVQREASIAFERKGIHAERAGRGGHDPHGITRRIRDVQLDPKVLESLSFAACAKHRGVLVSTA